MAYEDLLNTEDDDVREQSWADNATSYGELTKDEVFLGEVPFPSILESIQDQFANYLKLEDNEDYVDIFYNELNESYRAIEEDYDFHKDELKSVLDGIYSQFIDTMAKLFDQRFTITISDIENESGSREEIEVYIRSLYTFFVLDGKDHMKTAIMKDMCAKYGQPLSYQKPNARLLGILTLLDSAYSPTLHAIEPNDYLKYNGDEDILTAYEEGDIAGNFMRKLSARFYQYAEFRAEVASMIDDAIALIVQSSGIEPLYDVDQLPTNPGQQP